MGLRQRKKQQTRELIADTAWRLFADRGFERVTVAEIAREAQVSVATVFNYFPTKEDLFFYRLEAFGAQLVEAVGERPASMSALTSTISRPRRFNRLTVTSSARRATTTCPVRASWVRCTASRSPSRMPASRMDMPRTRRR